jgi:hypothetical protein
MDDDIPSGTAISEPDVQEICLPNLSEHRSDGPAVGTSIFVVYKL